MKQAGFKSMRKPIRERPLWIQYALAIGVVAFALLIRRTLDPVLGDDVPFMTVFIVLLPLVLLVRPGPFLAGALLGCAGALLLFVRPRYSFDIGDPRVRLQAALFVAGAAAAATTAWLARRTQHEASRADAMLRAFVDDSPTCKWVTDEHGRIVYVNRAMAEVLGRPVEEIFGLTHAEVLPQRLADVALGHIRAVRESGQPRISTEEVVPLGGRGERRILEWRRFAINLGDSARTLVAGMANDVTEKTRMELALRESEDRLQTELAKRTEEVKQASQSLALAQRLAAVGTMAAGLAHDINNITLPLSARMDVLLLNPDLDEEVKRELAVVTALIDHLRLMSRNLSLFSRDPDHEGAEGITDLVSWHERVRGLLEASLAGAPRGYGEAAVRLRFDLPADLPPVRVAPHRLTQAVLNVAHNARDAIVAARSNGPARDHGSITIRARARADRSAVLLEIIDEGCGMDEQTRRRAVEPFFTTKHRPLAPGSPGSGLGLALAHAICERVGGKLDITSELGKGTTVTITLPVADAADRDVTLREVVQRPATHIAKE